MKLKIYCNVYVTLSFLFICFILSVSDLPKPIPIKALNENLYCKSRSNPEKNKLSSTIKNNNSTTLIFSNPFYISNTILMLNKIPIEKSNTIHREVKFFIESGAINASLVTYNVGYYVEDSSMNKSNSKFKPLSTGLEIESVPNYVKGSCIFLTENGGIFKWNEFDQIIDKSNDNVLYTSMIVFFSH